MSINFGNTIIEPQTSIRVLGLQVDTKLKWGPHLAKVRAKMATQGLALKCLAGSTWGATFQKARTVSLCLSQSHTLGSLARCSKV